MQIELSLERNLRLILQGIQVAGFDQVRVYKLEREPNRFVCLEAVSTVDVKKVRGRMVSLEDNPYSRDAARRGPLDTAAHIYDPTAPEMFGPDPHSEEFGKVKDLPWANIALVIAGEYHGQILADNSISRREITSDTLEYLPLFAALAAQAIANAEIFDTLRASKLKDEFLQRMAHIFGTTTSGVDMLVQNIKDGIVNSEKALNMYIPAIANMNERFLGLAQNIIDFAALRQDTKLNIDSVDIVSLLGDIIFRFSVQTQEHMISIIPHFPPQRCYWRLDPARASSAIEALLDNAIKFSPVRSAVHIYLQMSDHEVSIVVRDQGLGVPVEELRFVFDSFYRGRNAIERHVEGSGLGLSIVHQTMKQHGGEAKVQNYPDGGAEFTLVFPKITRRTNEYDRE